MNQGPPKSCCCDFRTCLLILLGISIIWNLFVFVFGTGYTGKIGYLLVLVVNCLGFYGAWKHKPGFLKIFAGALTFSTVVTIILAVIVYNTDAFNQSISDAYAKTDQSISFDSYKATVLGYSYAFIAVETLWNIFIILRTRALWKYYESVEGQKYLGQPAVVQTA
ncbi:hypothetical protein HDV01_004572 [Terramyces sp. JEL0728]|nr:hypothetical protein HDV01_004572 [Terramyces sp. JEL0728]